MEQIMDLAKLEKEEADKEVVDFKAKYQLTLERQRKTDHIVALLHRT